MKLSLKPISIALLIISLFTSLCLSSFAATDSPVKKGDSLLIKVLEQEELGGAYVVSDKGTILFPLIDRNIECAGKTFDAIARDIKKELEADYFYKATVIVSPSDGSYFSGRSSQDGGTIYIYGRVNRQGAINIPKGEVLTVSKVIIRSGGFQEFANKRQVKLVRKAPISGKVTTIILNMSEIMDQGKMEKDVEVVDGDTIVVPEQFFNF